MRSLVKLFRSSRGTATIEFALLVPILMLLTGGIVEFGRIYMVYDQTDRLANQYANAWADCVDGATQNCATTTSSGSAGELGELSGANTVGNIFPMLQSANLTLQMFEVTLNSTASPTVLYPSGGSLGTAQTNAITAAGFNAAKYNGQYAVIVTATYQHSLMYFSSVMTPFLNPTGSSLLKPSYTVAQLKQQK